MVKTFTPGDSPGDWLAGLEGIGRGYLAVSQKLLGAVGSRFHDQTGSGAQGLACGEAGAGELVAGPLTCPI